MSVRSLKTQISLVKKEYLSPNQNFTMPKSPNTYAPHLRMDCRRCGGCRPRSRSHITTSSSDANSVIIALERGPADADGQILRDLTTNFRLGATRCHRVKSARTTDGGRSMRRLGGSRGGVDGGRVVDVTRLWNGFSISASGQRQVLMFDEIHGLGPSVVDGNARIGLRSRHLPPKRNAQYHVVSSLFLVGGNGKGLNLIYVLQSAGNSPTLIHKLISGEKGRD